MAIYRIILGVYIYTLGLSTQAQGQAYFGLPPVKNYTFEDYNAHAQNWAFIQDEREFIYVGNTQGLLEFDGYNWRTFPMAAPILEFGKSQSGRIYASGVGQFGYLAPSPEGEMQFRPLDDRLPEGATIGNLYTINALGTKVLFSGFHQIIIYDEETSELQVIQTTEKIYPSFVLDGKFYARSWERGLVTLVADSLIVAPKGEYFLEKEFNDVLVFGQDSVIALGSGTGAHVYTPAGFAQPRHYFTDEFYQSKGFYRAVSLQSGYAFCFLNGGIVVTDKSWQPILHLDGETGFENQTHTAFQDAQNNLWVGTNSGISYVELSSAVTTFSDPNGLNSAIYDLTVEDGTVYATGNSGVFKKPILSGFDLLRPEAKSFEKLDDSPGIGVKLVSNPFDLFSIHTRTIGTLKNDRFRELFPNKTNMAGGDYLGDSTTIITTSDLPDKIEVFKYRNGDWHYDKSLKLDKVPDGVFMRMAYDPTSQRVWGCTYQGQLVGFPYHKTRDEIGSVHIYDSTNNVNSKIFNIFTAGGELRWFGSDGVFEYLPSEDKFRLDTRFADHFKNSGGGFLGYQNDTTFWYSLLSGQLGLFTYDPVTKEGFMDDSFLKPFNILTAGNLKYDHRTGMLIPTMNGIAVARLPKTADKPRSEVRTSIRKVEMITESDSTVFKGLFPSTDSSFTFDQKRPYEFRSDEDAFRFSFAAPLYHGGNVTYQYQLVGFDSDWSAWSEKTEKEYTNLGPASYEFRVRAKNEQGDFTEYASFAFKIPPHWYLTPWAYLAYVGLFAWFVWWMVELNARRLRRENEKLESIIAERTEELQAQSEKLKALDKAKSRFFANISHELRTPLTLIQGPIESVLTGNNGKVTEEMKSNLELSYQSSRKLLNLIDEILDLSKLEAGSYDVKLQTVSLSELVQRIFYTYQSSSRAKYLKFDLQYALEDSGPVQLDIGKFEKVLDNLLSNALKFSKDHGAITLHVSQEGETLQFKVSDTGQGIPERDVDKVFDRYYQAENQGPLTGGSGIGLSLAKELALAMNGDISVESQFGEGSTFIFTIPHIVGEPAELLTAQPKDHPEIIETPQENGIDLSALREARILVVEDHDQMRKYIVDQIASEYQVDQAVDGINAYEKLCTTRYDLLITDLMMPRFDGFDLVRKLKAEDRYHDLAIIMLTARSGEDDIIEGLTIGINEYLTKPFNPTELQVRVRNIVSNLYTRKSASLDQEPNTTYTDKLILSIQEIVRQNLESTTFKIDSIADQVALSERQLNRKVKAITGLTIGNLVREIRLTEARKYLENKHFSTVSEVCYAVGFKKPDYFSEIFFKRFGKHPSDYLDALKV